MSTQGAVDGEADGTTIGAGVGRGDLVGDSVEDDDGPIEGETVGQVPHEALHLLPTTSPLVVTLRHHLISLIAVASLEDVNQGHLLCFAFPLLIVSNVKVGESTHASGSIVGGSVIIIVFVGEFVGFVQKLQDTGHSSCIRYPLLNFEQNFEILSAFVASSLEVSHSHFLVKRIPFFN